MLNRDIDGEIAFKIFRHRLFITAKEDRVAKFAEVKEEHQPAACATLKRHLTADAKFIA
jgi:hypothetical protein